MKKYKRLISSFLLAILLAFPAVSITGCGGTMSPQHIAIASEGSVVITADDGMQAWHDYVVDASHHVTQAQVATVKSYYEKYYTAQLVAKAALEKWVGAGSPPGDPGIAAANKAVTDATQALLQLITSYINPSR